MNLLEAKVKFMPSSIVDKRQPAFLYIMKSFQMQILEMKRLSDLVLYWIHFQKLKALRRRVIVLIVDVQGKETKLLT